MAWSYGGDPSANHKDAVRFLVGDVISADPQISDEGITYLLGLVSDNPSYAAVLAARSISATYSRRADTQAGDLRVSMSQKAKAYMELSAQLQIQADNLPGNTGMPIVTGTTWSDVQAVEANPDRIQPRFRMGQDDFYGADLDPADGAASEGSLQNP